VPVAVLSASRLLVAGDGVVLGPAGSTVDLPTIDSAAPAATGRAVADPSELAVARSLPASLIPWVARLQVDRGDQLVVVLRDGTKATFGDAGDAVTKGAVLEALVRWMAKTGTRVRGIDLTVAAAPAIVPA
jgi:hypothetical protein